MDVFDKPPANYLPMVQQSNPGNLEKFMVPVNDELWKVESYEQFLTERRKLIAEAINEYMDSLLGDGTLGQNVETPVVTAEEVIAAGESETVEFKSTLRWNINAQRNDKEIEHSALKTVAAFLNSDGGTLLIGVDDQGNALGLELDQFPNDDRMMQHMTNIIKERMGAQHMRFLRLSVELVNGKKVFRIDCQRGVVPAYLKYNNAEVFYIRTGPATADLPVSTLHDYINARFYR
jgi:Putative DNA-binding domain